MGSDRLHVSAIAESLGYVLATPALLKRGFPRRDAKYGTIIRKLKLPPGYRITRSQGSPALLHIEGAVKDRLVPMSARYSVVFTIEVYVDRSRVECIFVYQNPARTYTSEFTTDLQALVDQLITLRRLHVI